MTPCQLVAWTDIQTDRKSDRFSHRGSVDVLYQSLANSGCVRIHQIQVLLIWSHLWRARDSAEGHCQIFVSLRIGRRERKDIYALLYDEMARNITYS